MTDATWVHGYDPGTAGASTLLGPAGLVAVWAWKDRERGGEKCFQVVLVTRASDWRPVVTMRPTFGEVGAQIARQAARATGCSRWRVWQEATHVAKNVKTAIAGSWNAGAVVAPAQRFAIGRRIGQIQASEWRAGLLGLPRRTKRDAAKAASLAYMPPRIPGLADALGSIADALATPTTNLDHVTDSAGVAEYAKLYGGTDG